MEDDKLVRFISSFGISFGVSVVFGIPFLNDLSSFFAILGVSVALTPGVSLGLKKINERWYEKEKKRLKSVKQSLAMMAEDIYEKDKIIDGSKVSEGDAIIGIASSGFHSNGYSLIRKLVRDYNAVYEGEKIGETLLIPTKIYVKKVLPLLDKYNIKGMAHITGGGLIENVPRAVAKGYKAVIKKDSFQTPKIFNYIKYLGNIKEEEMYNTFNMGIGFVIIAAKEDKDNIINDLKEMNEYAYEIGYIAKNENEDKSDICLE